MSSTAESHEPLKALPLAALHRAAGAKWAPFAGYDMPIQYADGLTVEHVWTRERAGLFDVSHMGPTFVVIASPPPDADEAHALIAAEMEKLVASDIAGLKPGQIRYSALLNETGGIVDDVMIGRPADPAMRGSLYVVLNAGRKDVDLTLMQTHLSGRVALRPAGASLLALQGPRAAHVLERFVPGCGALSFMQFAQFDVTTGGRALVSRSGYTGEDGFEILIGDGDEKLAIALTEHEDVKWIGLGARDSLRLEAGLCLYGHDLDEDTSPVEAALSWTLGKARKTRGDFPGAKRIVSEASTGAKRKRVGIRPLDRAPAREGVEIVADGRVIGTVTSGGYSPLLKAPISMGYVETPFARAGTRVELMIRGKAHGAEIAPLPFIPHRYKRSAP